MAADPTPELVDDLLEILESGTGIWKRTLDTLDFAAATAAVGAPDGLAAVVAELLERGTSRADEALAVIAGYGPPALAAAAATGLRLTAREVGSFPVPRATGVWILDGGDAYVLAVAMEQRGAVVVGTVVMGDIGEGVFVPMGGGVVLDLREGGAAAWVNDRARALGARASKLSENDARDRIEGGVEDVVALAAPVPAELVVALPLIWAALGGARHSLPCPEIEPEDDLDGDLGEPLDEGFAGRLVAHMDADGVKPTDRDAVDAWMEDFNRRSFEERGEMLGPRDAPPPPSSPPAQPPRHGGRGGQSMSKKEKRRR